MPGGVMWRLPGRIDQVLGPFLKLPSPEMK